jgi:hypothetical protein
MGDGLCNRCTRGILDEARWAQNWAQRESEGFWRSSSQAANSMKTKEKFGGRDRDRTGDPLLAKQVLSQLSYTPKVLPVSIISFNTRWDNLGTIRSPIFQPWHVWTWG